MNYIRFVSFIVLFAAIITGCSSPSVITQSDNPGTVMEKVRQRNSAIKSLIGNGKVSFDSQEMSGSGNMELRISRPDSALIKISGPFGISVANGLITSDAFTLYNGTNNTVVRGETTARNLRRALRISIEFSDILEILSGSMGVSSELSGSIPKGEYADGTYNLTFNVPDGTNEYRINPDYASVSRFIAKDTEGNILRDIRFRDFRRNDGIYMPHIISITRPAHEESLTLVYDRLRINTMPIDFTFSVPGGARKIEL